MEKLTNGNRDSLNENFTENWHENLQLSKVYADPYKGGYTSLYLRTDAAKAYDAVRKELISQGAILASSGTMRSLDTEVTQSRSPVSFHYIGLAIDLHIYAGMVNVATDPYLVVRESEQMHRVYARCNVLQTFNICDSPKTQISLPPEIELTRIVTYDQRDCTRNAPIRGPFIDVTAVFEKNGFRPIRARRNFYDGGSMMEAEWWHFQYETGLIPSVTTFGSQLLKIYSEDILRRTQPWRERDRVFQDNWF